MNILFLSLIDFNSIEEHNIYTDILREFRKDGHKIYAVSPSENNFGRKTKIIEENGSTILKVETMKVLKTNFIKKGIATLQIECLFKRAIKRFFKNVKFDLVLYPTPPITLVGAVKYIKKRDDAKTYLMLKDIFPQNAVDLGVMKTTGIMSIIYRYFLKKEKELYSISDKIGCMSLANMRYIILNNPQIAVDKVTLCPNSIEIQSIGISDEERRNIRRKYKIPQDKKVFVYGGNLGKPQGISFVIECIKSQAQNKDIYFLIIGSGTEYKRLETHIKEYQLKNILLMKQLPKDEYDKMIAACDVGMIFLDYRFTIPNFPSRLLSYMQAKLPVLACTDPNTDLGKVIADGDFGWWCYSDNINNFTNIVSKCMSADLNSKGENAYTFLKENYSAEGTYRNILDSIVI